MNRGRILLGLLAGIAAGAIIGILVAPDKGTETRKKIANKGFGYLTGFGRKFDEMVDDITNKAEMLKKDAGKMASNGKAKLEQVEDKFANAMRS